MLTRRTRTASYTSSRRSSIRTPILRDGAYADLILPDTTYLERWDCISLLDRPISEADGPAIRSASRWSSPTATCALPGPCCSTRRAAGPARLDVNRRLAALSGRLSRLHRQPRAQPRHRPARRLARRGKAHGKGAPNPDSCSATSRTAASGATSCPSTCATTSMPTAAISTGRQAWASSASRAGHRSSSIPSRCRSSAWPPGPWRASSRPSTLREAHRAPTSTRCPSGIRRFEGEMVDGSVPAARRHAAADGDVPLLGLAERLAAADPRPQPALHGARAWRPRSSASPMTTGSGSPAPAGVKAQVRS
jgi:hypothetical protein